MEPAEGAAFGAVVAAGSQLDGFRGGPDKGAEKEFRCRMVQGFGMPLHRCKKAVIDAFQGFDDPVGGNSRFPQLRGYAGRGLMMEAVDGNGALSQNTGQASSGQDFHTVRGLAAGGFLPVLQGACSTEILDQASAQGCVHHLQAAADPQKGQPAEKRRPHQGKLPGVAPGIHFTQTGTGLLAVVKGGQIAAPAEQEPVKGTGKILRSRWFHRGEQQRDRSRLLQPAAVRQGQPEQAPALTAVNGNSDTRFFSH